MIFFFLNTIYAGAGKKKRRDDKCKMIVNETFIERKKNMLLMESKHNSMKDY